MPTTNGFGSLSNLNSSDEFLSIAPDQYADTYRHRVSVLISPFLYTTWVHLDPTLVAIYTTPKRISNNETSSTTNVSTHLRAQPSKHIHEQRTCIVPLLRPHIHEDRASSQHRKRTRTLALPLLRALLSLPPLLSTPASIPR